MVKKGTLDSIGLNCYKKGTDWYRDYRKFWKQIEEDKKKVKR